MISDSYRKHRGFTLVELMVAMALSIFLIGGVSLTYLAGRAASQDAERLSRIQENMRFASDYLLRDLRLAGFRDQVSLNFEEFGNIGDNFVSLNDSRDELTIKYAGRGHCAQARDPERNMQIIENTYRVADSNLICCGRAVELGVTPPECTPVALTGGIANVRFEFFDSTNIRDGAILDCSYDTSEDLASSCIGVAIEMGIQGFDENDIRTANLQVAFRNVVADKIFRR